MVLKTGKFGLQPRHSCTQAAVPERPSDRHHRPTKPAAVCLAALPCVLQPEARRLVLPWHTTVAFVIRWPSASLSILPISLFVRRVFVGGCSRVRRRATLLSLTVPAKYQRAVTCKGHGIARGLSPCATEHIRLKDEAPCAFSDAQYPSQPRDSRTRWC